MSFKFSRKVSGFSSSGRLARLGALAAAASAAALCASAAHATAVTDSVGDILSSFDRVQHTTDDFRDLDITAASVVYNGENFILSATMDGAIGSTDTGFYVWGVNTGTGTDFFQQQADHPTVGQGVIFDTFLVLNADGTGSANYFSGEASEAFAPGSITISGNTIRAVVSRDVVESTGFDVSQFTFNLWSRTTGFAHNSDIPDFAPDASNFAASAVPEPAAWAMMIAGFGFAGSRLRRRRLIAA